MDLLIMSWTAAKGVSTLSPHLFLHTKGFFNLLRHGEMKFLTSVLNLLVFVSVISLDLLKCDVPFESSYFCLTQIRCNYITEKILSLDEWAFSLPAS